MKFNRWTLLTSGVSLAIGCMLAANHMPWPKPDIGENRILTGLPITPEGLEGLEEYRKGMDAYIADNFPARSWFIAGINYARFQMGYSGTPRVIVGRDGWLFYDDGNHLMQLRHGMPLTDEQLQAWVTTFAARTEALRQEGIAYYVVTPPVKERIFPELAPSWAAGAGQADAEDLKARVEAAGLENFIVLKQTLADARVYQPRVYSLYDTHWTGYGAYAGYVRIMNTLKGAGLVRQGALPLDNFILVDKPDPSRHDLAAMLGIASFVTQNFPRFHDAQEDSAVRVTYLTAQHDWTGDRVIDTGRTGAPVLQLVVDSFSNDLLPFLYPHFSRIVVSHNQNGFFRRDLTNAYHPNIVVIEVLESAVRHSMNPAMEPSPDLARKLAALNGASSPNPGQASSDGSPISQVNGGVLSDDEARNAAYSCNLEEVSVTGSAQDGLSGSGWIADVLNDVASPDVAILLRSNDVVYSVQARAGIARPDVASHFGKADIVSSGFSFNVRDAAFKDGVYQVFLSQRFDTRRLICRVSTSIEVARGKMRVLKS